MNQLEVVGLILWCAVLTGFLASLHVKYTMFMKVYKNVQNVQTTKHKRYIVPGMGVFTSRKKISPTINDDAKGWEYEQKHKMESTKA